LKTKLTIKNIAEMAGVSIGTVDRALNNRPGINEKTKDKILSLTEEFGYKTNRFASALVKAKDIRIGVIAPFTSFVSYDIERGMKQAQNELSDYSIEMEFFYTKYFETKKQIEILENINHNDFDALLINACGKPVEKYLNKYFDNRIPVATFNSDITTSKRLFYIGQNSYKAGALAAGLVHRNLSHYKRVVVFTGFKDVDSHKLRCCGFMDEVKRYMADVDIIGPIEYFDDDNCAFKIATEEFVKHANDIGIIFITTEPGTIGVVNAAKAYYKEKMPLIIGYDYNEHVRDFLMNNYCFATIHQSPFAQGYFAVKMLFNHIMHGWVPKSDNIFINSNIILKQNIDEFEVEETDIGSYMGLSYLM